MPKFFVTSDIHSFYTELIHSLKEAGFDRNNEDHWLVVCGDCFDRGPDARRTFRYLKSLPRKILIRGNHEQLLVDLCKRGYAMSHDMHNGTTRTVFDLGKTEENFCEKCQTTLTKVRPFLKSMVNYFETKNHIFVHGWFPVWISDWRNASQKEWDEAVWENPFQMIEDGLMPDKTIVFGHRSCSEAWAINKGMAMYGKGAKFDPYYGDGYIAIDALTYHSGQKNVIVIEDEFI